MMDYTKYSPQRKPAQTNTPQSQPIPSREPEMVKNAAGGYVFPTGKWAQLMRFVVLGTEGGTFYINERELTLSNCKAAQECLVEDGKRVVDMVLDVSTNNRALKQEPALFVLALAASFKADLVEPKKPDQKGMKKADFTKELATYTAKRSEYDAAAEVRRHALANLHKVARTATALYHWTQYVQNMRGWGRSLRSTVADWYLLKAPDKVAYQALKYKSRDGWSHRDLFRLGHPKPTDVIREELFRYIARPDESLLTQGLEAVEKKYSIKKSKVMEEARAPLMQVAAAEELLHITDTDSSSVAKAVKLIRDYNLPREAVPTQLQKSPEVWEALLDKMPLTAMIRTLNRMTAAGLLATRGEGTAKVLAALGNAEQLQNARLHPMQVLVAMRQYQEGKGDKGSLSWTPVQRIIDGLNDAFYDTFKFVEPTGKDLLVAVDVSGSMRMACSGLSKMTASEAAAAMALVMVSTEPNIELLAFDTGHRALPITPRMRLDAAMNVVSRMVGGGTDLAQPFHYANGMSKSARFNAVVSFTDNETWAGRSHPMEVLQQARRHHGNLLAINCATAANHGSVLDPKYTGVLEVAGMDASLPTLVNEFVKGYV